MKICGPKFEMMCNPWNLESPQRSFRQSEQHKMIKWKQDREHQRTQTQQHERSRTDLTH
jgi:hypothetical protein